MDDEEESVTLVACYWCGSMFPLKLDWMIADHMEIHRTLCELAMEMDAQYPAADGLS